MSHI